MLNGTVEAHGTNVKQTLLRAPKMNSHCERVIQTVRHECTDHFAIFGRRHLMHLLKSFERYITGYGRIRESAESP